MLSFCRVTQRVFRKNIRSTLVVDKYNILITYNKQIIKVNIKEKSVKIIHKVDSNWSTPLNLSKSISNKFIALFGDYGNNQDYKQCNIYGITQDYKVVVLYTFKKGLRHIHNIIPNSLRNGYYIFTGDNEKDAGIYSTDLNFDNVVPLLIGKQIYRAVSGFHYKNILYYATDSVEEKNYVYKINTSTNTLEKLSRINGPSIYSTIINNQFIFSTTVESSENRDGNIVKKMLSKKPSLGTLSKKFYIHIINDDQCRIIDKYTKDNYPYKLMQYGTVIFGDTYKSNRLHYYVQSAKWYENSTIVHINGIELFGGQYEE